MISKIFQESISKECRSQEQKSFSEKYIMFEEIQDTLSNLSDDLDKIVLKKKKKNPPNKIGKRGFMLDNINKKLKGNFFKYIFYVFKSFGFKLKRLPQSFITNVSSRINKQFIDKPLSYLFEHYGITIPKELSLTLHSGSILTDIYKDDTFSKISKRTNIKINNSKLRKENTLFQIQNCEKASSEISFLKKIVYEYNFEYVFDKIFLKSEYFAKLIEEFKNDPRYTQEYIDKFLKLAEQCCNKLKG